MTPRSLALVQKLYALASLALVATAAAPAAVVRGRLSHAAAPAAGIAVTVSSQQYGRSTAAYSGSDGIYYLPNLPPGAYKLEVWNRPGSPPIILQIVVREPATDVPPVTLP